MIDFSDIQIITGCILVELVPVYWLCYWLAFFVSFANEAAKILLKIHFLTSGIQKRNNLQTLHNDLNVLLLKYPRIIALGLRQTASTITSSKIVESTKPFLNVIQKHSAGCPNALIMANSAMLNSVEWKC